MKMIPRPACVLTDQEDLEPLYSFKDFPVFMGCTTASPETDLKADMNWFISKETGLIQLDPLLPLDVLYPEAHGAGCVGALWEEHHRTLAEFLRGSAPSRVLEIGGSHGLLAKFYCEKTPIDWTIIEPNPAPVTDCPAKFIKGFFDEKFLTTEPYDTVVHSHVLEHIYEPNVFMRDLGAFCPPGTRLVFSIPNMKVMLERSYTNCINFEHTLFLTEPYLDFLLAKHGFRLEQKVLFKDDHSLFYAAIRDPETKPQLLPHNLYEVNKSIYNHFVKTYSDLIDRLNTAVSETSQSVYLFGAHIFAQYLLAFGLDTTKIICILDNDPHKAGKRLYGTSLTVQSPKCLRDVDQPVVILKAGIYNDEIRNDILHNINPSTTFLE